MVNEVAKNIYSIEVDLPENPLRWLNSYFISGGTDGRNLVIDTGFNRPECHEALLGGLKELNADFGRTDVFITHSHSDHCGNAGLLESLGCRVFMGEKDYKRLSFSKTERIHSADARMLLEGMSQSLIDETYAHNPAIIYRSEKFSATLLNEGDELSYGGYTLKAVFTPGHTPGHMCLFDSKNKLMFTGDHVLYDISPNITFWPDAVDSLGDYLESLKKVRNLDVVTALPAHRNLPVITLAERVDQLLDHHDRRLAELVNAAAEHPGSTAYELAGLVHWRIRARNWEEFPPAQKWFAVGETIAHLDYLTIRGKIRREEADNVRVYYID